MFRIWTEYSVRVRENTDQNNSEYGHFSRSAVFSQKHVLTTINYFWRLYTTFSGHTLLSIAFGGYIILLTATYYLRRLHTTFDGYVLLLAWHDCDFARIQDFPAISRICGLKGRLEFNNNLLVLVQFHFFCSLMFSSINFNLPFWKCCFIKNTQMLKMWNFLDLALQMVCKGNN